VRRYFIPARRRRPKCSARGSARLNVCVACDRRSCFRPRRTTGAPRLTTHGLSPRDQQEGLVRSSRRAVPSSCGRPTRWRLCSAAQSSRRPPALLATGPAAVEVGGFLAPALRRAWFGEETQARPLELGWRSKGSCGWSPPSSSRGTFEPAHVCRTSRCNTLRQPDGRCHHCRSWGRQCGKEHRAALAGVHQIASSSVVSSRTSSNRGCRLSRMNRKRSGWCSSFARTCPA
jgi:hypothetical protein